MGRGKVIFPRPILPRYPKQVSRGFARFVRVFYIDGRTRMAAKDTKMKIALAKRAKV